MAPISIQFQLDDQTPTTATLPSDFKLNDFQAAIKDLFGDKYWMYSFICHGKSFDAKNEIEIEQMKTNLVPGMTLFMYMRAKGGGMNSMGTTFVNVADESCRKRLEFSRDKNGPAWYVARPGLCLEGQCQTGKCEAYKKTVIVNIGFKKFDLNREKKSLSKCPQCQSYIRPITCAFNRCEWRYEGQMQTTEDDEPTEFSIAWRKADCAYYRFDPDKGESVNWIYLVLEAKAHQRQ